MSGILQTELSLSDSALAPDSIDAVAGRSVRISRKLALDNAVQFASSVVVNCRSNYSDQVVDSVGRNHEG
jgi:hypothetical protein